MATKKLIPNPKLFAAMAACVDHARALLESAKAVHASGHPNVAYHLATLTLEELGRRALIGVQFIAQNEAVPPEWPKKHEQDHIKKLFWAFFGVEFSAQVLTAKSLQEMTELAERIHDIRLAGLYVDNNEEGLSIPADAVTKEQAEQLIDFAEARLGMAEAEKPREAITQEEVDLQTWFLTAVDDLEHRKMIFSKGSMEKLAELKNAQAWGRWLKDQFDGAEVQSREAVAREIERSRNAPTEKSKEKWKVRVRILCASHSIRPKALTAWNENSDWIKLTAVSGKKNELLIDFILGDNVPVDALWWFAWGVARHFVVALNIGSMGFWWWRMPEQISRFYESIRDVEAGLEMKIERRPSLKIDWGENRVLTIEDLARSAAVFAALPRRNPDGKTPGLDNYIGGLTFLSLNDIHWQCEVQSFGNFFECLRLMMEQHGDWKPGDPFEAAFIRFVDKLFPSFDEKDRYTALIRAFDANDLKSVKITLKEVSFIKLFCDAYILLKLLPKPAAVATPEKPASDAAQAPPAAP
jgi:AbiV family abortive infection protein